MYSYDRRRASVSVTEDLIDKVLKAVETYPEFKHSGGRVPSWAWVKQQVDKLHGRAQDEDELIEMVIDERRDMIERVKNR